MYVLRIEHGSLTYDGWKAAFDADPVGRKSKGVRRHQVLRAETDPNQICVDLTFETVEEANALLSAMGEVWKRVTGTLIDQPRTSLFQVAESKDY